VGYEHTLINYFIHASLVVKCVMLILLGASILSWTYILQRGFYLKAMKQMSARFESAFLAENDLSKLYSHGTRHKKQLHGLEAIFHAGFQEFLSFRRQAGVTMAMMIDNIKRAMRIAEMQEQDKLEKYLSFLAIVANTCPYIGLFGTVWGIMQAFSALSTAQQATIAMVAPGIAEALVATALGLFAAIPAVIAYNRFSNDISRLQNRYLAFEDELTNLFIHQTHQTATAATV
jgi:biopolymer transport protein TolQ